MDHLYWNTIYLVAFKDQQACTSLGLNYTLAFSSYLSSERVRLSIWCTKRKSSLGQVELITTPQSLRDVHGNHLLPWFSHRHLPF